MRADHYSHSFLLFPFFLFLLALHKETRRIPTAPPRPMHDYVIYSGRTDFCSFFGYYAKRFRASHFLEGKGSRPIVRRRSKEISGIPLGLEVENKQRANNKFGQIYFQIFT